MADAESFILNYFPRLPNNVIFDISKYLPGEYIGEVFLRTRHLAVRNSIIELYYRKELHLILSPTRRPHQCTHDQNIHSLIDIESYYEIEEFLLENRDINPNKLVIITGGDFISLSLLLNKFKSRFINEIRYLEILIEKYEPSNSDLNLLLSFPNLKKLQFSGCKLVHCLDELAMISDHSSLQEIIFLGHRINNWEKIKLPSNLQHLDISWNNSSNINSLELPSSITDIYWNQAGINNLKLLKQKFPNSLKVLMLSYNNISSIYISLLPKTLEVIDLSYNAINKFPINSAKDSWPSNLKSILLSHNLIDNESLKSLSLIQWPEFLVNLKIDNNPFTDLSNLLNLPDNLDFLDLSSNKLNTFEINNNELFKFPKFLQTLNLSNSEKLMYHSYNDPFKRIRFPSTLINLNLSECNIKDLNHFEFPTSLTKLSLSGNKIEDLSLYNLTINDKEIINWKQLINLIGLELYFNQINNLNGWNMPINLKKMDLRLNNLSILTNEFFSNNLEILNVGENNISIIEENISLPKNLKILKLNNNTFANEFKFFKLSKNLEQLDLSGNLIKHLVFDHSQTHSQGEDNMEKNNLKELNLSGNLILKDRNNENIKLRVDDFYSNLEKGLNIKVIKKKFSINSLHMF